MAKSSLSLILAVVASMAAIAFMISTIIVALRLKDREDDTDDLEKKLAAMSVIEKTIPNTKNPCDGAKKTFANILGGLLNTDCFEDGKVASTVPPQAGADVTKGYKGQYEVQGQFTEGNLPVADLENLLVPKAIMTPFYMQGMCPVNVHWHLGTEHRSEGQYDETGTGPTEVGKRRLDGSARKGGQCKLFDKEDEKFTKPFEWKHCEKMEVGQTYEVHWPHSKLGACGTPWQYQNPFYDGITCDLSKIENVPLGSAVLSQHVGVQAQIFVIVNDEDYYYSNLFGGMITDKPLGEDLAIYTGSTTGTSRSNIECSTWGPVTWQVDRACHMVSASSFDKMCADMKGNADDLTKDLDPDGSRPVVDEKLAIAQETP